MISMNLDNEYDRCVQSNYLTYKKPLYNVKNLFDVQSSDCNATESSINSCISPMFSQANRSCTTSISSYDKIKEPLKLEIYDRKSLMSFDMSSLGSFNIDFDSINSELEREFDNSLSRSEGLFWEDDTEIQPALDAPREMPTSEEFETVSDVESIMESLKEYTMMDKLKDLFRIKRPKESSIKFPFTKEIATVIKKPILSPGISRSNGPIDMSIFQNLSEESSIYEGNVRFKSNVDFFVYDNSSMTSFPSPLENKYPGLETFPSKPKRNFSISCISKTLTIPRFSSKKSFMERSLSLPRRFIWPTTSGRNGDNRSILKTKLNQNYEVEAQSSNRDDQVDFDTFLSNFENSEKEKQGNEPHLNSLRIKQLQNYYHNYS